MFRFDLSHNLIGHGIAKMIDNALEYAKSFTFQQCATLVEKYFTMVPYYLMVIIPKLQRTN